MDKIDRKGVIELLATYGYDQIVISVNSDSYDVTRIEGNGEARKLAQTGAITLSESEKRYEYTGKFGSLHDIVEREFEIPVEFKVVPKKTVRRVVTRRSGTDIIE